jgi:hypothetical protein
LGRTGWSGSPTFTSLSVSSQWAGPPEDGFGLGGGGTDRVDPGDDKPCPAGLLGVGGADFAANFSLRAFCMQSGQVTSLAFADWNHLPQTMQRIFTLLMRFLPCTMQNFQVHTLLLRRNALSSIAGFRNASIFLACVSDFANLSLPQTTSTHS